MPGPAFLDGDEVTLRAVEPEDAPFLSRLLSDPQVWRPAFDADPMTEAEAAAFVEEELVESSGVHCLACHQEEPMGLLSLSTSSIGPHETSRARAAELGCLFAPAHHGEGYGTDATRRLVRYAFEDRNLRRLNARVAACNDPAASLLESLGFQQEGTLREAAWYRGEFYDMYHYGLLRDEWRER